MVLRPNIPTPPVQSTHTPPQAPSFTPGAASHARQSPALSAGSAAASTPPPSAVSRVSTTTSTEAPALQLPQRHQGHYTAPFQLDLPWCSVPEEAFPPRARHKRRVINYETSIEFPLPLSEQVVPSAEPNKESIEAAAEAPEEAVDPTEETSESQASTLAPASEHDTPATSQAPSEIGSEQPTTPISTAPPRQLPTHTRTATKPVVPVIPKFPKPASPVAKKESSVAPADIKEKEGPALVIAHSSPGSDTSKSSATVQPSSEKLLPEATPDHAAHAQPDVQSPPPPKAGAPKLWADLVRTKPTAGEVKAASVNGVSKHDAVNGAKANSFADVIRSFSVDTPTKTTFFQPRGLVNSGNMCYMNSVSW
jgi:ubiquitin carboxyl-terminal hydrolase 10